MAESCVIGSLAGDFAFATLLDGQCVFTEMRKTVNRPVSISSSTVYCQTFTYPNQALILLPVRQAGERTAQLRNL